MKSEYTSLTLDAEESFTILHITDTHLSYADMRDGIRKVNLAQKRQTRFPDAAANLYDCNRWAKKHNALIVHTGDLIDFVSRKNLEEAKRFVYDSNCFCTAGNHEFSLYVGEAFEDEAYRNKSLTRVQAVFNNDIRFSSRVYRGVNLVAIDNSYYRFEGFQLKRLKEEAARGLPILLFLHTPLYTQELFDYITGDLGEDSAGLLGVPEEHLTSYSEHRLKQQKPDDITIETYNYITSQPLITAVFAGHLHFSFQTKISSTLPQYITGGNYLGESRIIRVNAKNGGFNLG